MGEASKRVVRAFDRAESKQTRLLSSEQAGDYAWRHFSLFDAERRALGL
jgi:hypothetical protein